MTTDELIEELKKYPGLEVRVYDTSYDDWEEPTNVQIQSDKNSTFVAVDFRYAK